MDYENDSGWVRPYLGVGEYVLWSGKPGEGHLLAPNDVFLIPFSILWCGFAIFWEITVLSVNAPLIFKLFGIPFVLIGLYIMIGRFIYKGYIRKRTSYVVTNQRLFRIRNKKVDTLEGNAKTQLSVSVNKDGSGTITFGNPAWKYSRLLSWSYENAGFEFRDIEDVNRVRQIILNMDN